MITQYKAMSKSNRSKVIFCFDCDVEQKDADFLKEAKKYCDDKCYEFVWFCKDVEMVYLDKKVDDGRKKQQS